MKKYEGIESITKFVFRILEEKAKTNPDWFTVEITRTYNPEPEDVLESIVVDDRPKPGLRSTEIEVGLYTKCIIPNPSPPLDETIAITKRKEKLQITAYVELVKILSDKKWLVKLLDSHLIIEWFHPQEGLPENEFFWLTLRDDETPDFRTDFRILELENKKEVLQYLL